VTGLRLGWSDVIAARPIGESRDVLAYPARATTFRRAAAKASMSSLVLQ
jgi:hypothetical protein